MLPMSKGDPEEMVATIQDMTSKVIDMGARLSDLERQGGKASDHYQRHLQEFASAWHMLQTIRSENDFLPRLG